MHAKVETRYPNREACNFFVHIENPNPKPQPSDAYLI